jgi:hypothetical protein
MPHVTILAADQVAIQPASPRSSIEMTLSM